MECLEREVKTLKSQRPGTPSSRATTPLPGGEDDSSFVVVLGTKPDSCGPNWEKNRRSKLIKQFLADKDLPEGASVKRKG